MAGYPASDHRAAESEWPPASCTLVVRALLLVGTKPETRAGAGARVHRMAVRGGGRHHSRDLFPRQRFPLGARIDASCGDVGYGVYLNQSVTLVFWFAWPVAAGRTDYLYTPPALYLVLAAATIVLAWATWAAIEVPCNRGGRSGP